MLYKKWIDIQVLFNDKKVKKEESIKKNRFKPSG